MRWASLRSAQPTGCILWDCDWALRAALDGPTLLNQTPLYRQRAAGQGFFSQAETTLKHLRSSIEIRERLGTGFNGDVTLPPHLRAAFRRASALAYFNLAYYLQAHGQPRAALHAWLDSQRRSPQPAPLQISAARDIWGIQALGCCSQSRLSATVRQPDCWFCLYSTLFKPAQEPIH